MNEVPVDISICLPTGAAVACAPGGPLLTIAAVVSVAEFIGAARALPLPTAPAGGFTPGAALSFEPDPTAAPPDAAPGGPWPAMGAVVRAAGALPDPAAIPAGGFIPGAALSAGRAAALLTVTVIICN
jgi:hypothetical protein